MYIYLIDYNYNGWFYIGKTSYSLDERYKSHFYSLKKSKTLNHKIWNKSLSLGNIPEIILLEKCDESNINELEKFWIEYFKFLGIKITNLTNGGEGVKGLVFTENHKNNLGLNRKGKGLGSNLKISESNKGKPKPKPKGFGIGRKHSQATKDKMSEKALDNIIKTDRNHTSKLEKTFSNILDLLDIKYEKFFYAKEIKAFYDFFISESNLIIEIDGDFWHCNPLKFPIPQYETQKKNLIRDKEKEQWALNKGYKLLRFWENDINNNILEVKKTLLENIKKK
jgi:very-short-patch-repair endonuclease